MSAPSARRLGLDLGDVRIGVAVSDPLGITAQPLEYVACVGPRKDAARIAQLVQHYEAATVVVGLPLHLSGAEGDGARRAREFAARLEGRLPGVEIVMWDERMTTAEAQRVLIAGDVRRSRRRETIDSLAAVLLLQSYLDARSSGWAVGR